MNYTQKYLEKHVAKLNHWKLTMDERGFGQHTLFIRSETLLDLNFIMRPGTPLRRGYLAGYLAERS